MLQPSLDELYQMIAYIYSEQNAYRSATATFAHFVEVCGTLTVEARDKKRERLTFVDVLCKSLGWYFPLLAKFKIASVEDLIYRKYPYTCPYCRLTPHIEDACKTILMTERTVNHAALKKEQARNAHKRPRTLGEWQRMFQKIYPRAVTDIRANHSVLGLFEELGEMAEAIRVFERHPKYFIGEAADVFSYLMGLANEYSLTHKKESGKDFSLEDEFLRRYPGLCVQCGHTVCICPMVPESTVGRLAKELEIENFEELFSVNPEIFRRDSAKIASSVLGRVGGYSGIIDQFPFDRGDANKALVMFCIQMAEAMDEYGDPKIAESAETLRSTAIKIGTAATYPGSRKSPVAVEQMVRFVRGIIANLPLDVRKAVGLADQTMEMIVGSTTLKIEPDFFEPAH